jgi:hypothetical protein
MNLLNSLVRKIFEKHGIANLEGETRYVAVEMAIPAYFAFL